MSVVDEGSLAAPAAEGLSLRPRRALGQQAAGALDPAAVRAVALGTLEAGTEYEEAVQDGVELPRCHRHTPRG